MHACVINVGGAYGGGRPAGAEGPDQAPPGGADGRRPPTRIPSPAIARTDLFRSPLDRRITALALPAFGTLAAEPLYLVADTAIVGRLGTQPLAGLALAAVGPAVRHLAVQLPGLRHHAEGGARPGCQRPEAARRRSVCSPCGSASCSACRWPPRWRCSPGRWSSSSAARARRSTRRSPTCGSAPSASRSCCWRWSAPASSAVSPTSARRWPSCSRPASSTCSWRSSPSTGSTWASPGRPGAPSSSRSRPRPPTCCSCAATWPPRRPAGPIGPSWPASSGRGATSCCGSSR